MMDKRDRKLGNKPEKTSDFEQWERLLAEILKTNRAPDLPPEKSAAILAELKPLVAARQEDAQNTPAKLGWRGFMQLVKAQASLFEKPFWGIVGFMILLNLALMVTGLISALVSIAVLILPLVGGISLAYNLHLTSKGLWEIEQTSPTGTGQIFLARLAVTFAAQIVLVLPALALVATQGGLIALGWGLLTWLGPTAGLSGLMLFLLSYWGEWPSLGTALLLWGGIVALTIRRGTLIGFGSWLLEGIATNPLLPILAALGLVLGLGLGLMGTRRLLAGSRSWV